MTKDGNGERVHDEYAAGHSEYAMNPSYTNGVYTVHRLSERDGGNILFIPIDNIISYWLNDDGTYTILTLDGTYITREPPAMGNEEP